MIVFGSSRLQAAISYNQEEPVLANGQVNTGRVSRQNTVISLLCLKQCNFAKRRVNVTIYSRCNAILSKSNASLTDNVNIKYRNGENAWIIGAILNCGTLFWITWLASETLQDILVHIIPVIIQQQSTKRVLAVVWEYDTFVVRVRNARLY